MATCGVDEGVGSSNNDEAISVGDGPSDACGVSGVVLMVPFGPTLIFNYSSVKMK